MCSVLVSLFVSFSLDPMLSARLARARRPGEAHGPDHPAVARIRAFFEANDRGYARTLDWVLRHRLVTIASATARAEGRSARLATDGAIATAARIASRSASR